VRATCGGRLREPLGRPPLFTTLSTGANAPTRRAVLSEISKQMTLQIADDYAPRKACQTAGEASRPARTAHTACDLGNAGSPRTRCGNRDRQRLACSRSELDDVRAVVLRPVDHDPIPTIERHDCHPCFGGSLCTNSGHRSSITARISSEMKSMRSYSRSSLCSRSKSADVMT